MELPFGGVGGWGRGGVRRYNYDRSYRGKKIPTRGLLFCLGGASRKSKRRALCIGVFQRWWLFFSALDCTSS